MENNSQYVAYYNKNKLLLSQKQLKPPSLHSIPKGIGSGRGTTEKQVSKDFFWGIFVFGIILTFLTHGSCEHCGWKNNYDYDETTIRAYEKLVNVADRIAHRLLLPTMTEC